MANQQPRQRPLAPGEMADGTINAGTPDDMRPKLELWRRQQEALARGEDPTLLEPGGEDASDLDDYDDL